MRLRKTTNLLNDIPTSKQIATISTRLCAHVRVSNNKDRISENFKQRMDYMFPYPGRDKPTVGRKSLDRENLICQSISGGKPNRCVIFLANVSMVAKAIERRNQDWIVRTNFTSDLIIQVGDSTFFLHKRNNNGKRDTSPIIQLDNLLGGTKTFELLVRFCYGWKVDLIATNIAPFYCVAHFLEMREDLEPGNLMSKTEAFLSFLILTSWKDTFWIFKSCESFSTWAKELEIVKMCSEAIAWKACSNSKAFSFSEDDAECLNTLANADQNSKLEDRLDNWWFEDVSFLRIDHFIEVIHAIKSKGMKLELVGSCIAHWTAKRLSRITFGLDQLTPKHMNKQTLSAKSFHSLAEALPKDARYCDDNLYRAIDMYLKIHLSLTEEERLSVCRSLEYHRLSQEAREHVMKNDKLPLKMMTQFIHPLRASEHY